MYANDSQIISPATTTKEQVDLEKLSDCAKLWRLEIKIKKCRTIYFGRNNVRGQYHICGIDGVGEMISSSHSEKPGYTCG